MDWSGGLKYESDGNVPTGERKPRAFGVGTRRKKGGSLGVGSEKKFAFFGVNFSKLAGIWCKFCQF